MRSRVYILGHWHCSAIIADRRHLLQLLVLQAIGRNNSRCSANGATRVAVEPHVNAIDVESVAALRQAPSHVALLKSAQADNAFGIVVVSATVVAAAATPALVDKERDGGGVDESRPLDEAPGGSYAYVMWVMN